MNELLHHQRSAHLAEMPPDADVLLSAGCAGSWYFDWIERYYGPVARHVGVEFYVPRPTDLPDNAEWIENTVGRMTDVEDGSVDLVFSGQNVEHLWLDDMVDFFLEAARVLRDGGHLVIDSPNRTQTAALGWSHPEHTVELTVGEAEHALALSGFEVTKRAGLWLIDELGATSGFEPRDPADEIIRAVRAVDHPERSFVWWLEAAKVGDPQPSALRQHVQEVFRTAWPERLQRFSTLGAHVLPGSGDLVNEIGHPATVMFGPYTPLPAGRFEVGFTIMGLDAMVESPGSVDIMVGDQAIEARTIPALSPDQRCVLRCEFELVAAMNFGVQFRVHSNGTAGFRTCRRVDFVDLSEATLGPVYCRRPAGDELPCGTTTRNSKEHDGQP